MVVTFGTKPVLEQNRVHLEVAKNNNKKYISELKQSAVRVDRSEQQSGAFF